MAAIEKMILSSKYNCKASSLTGDHSMSIVPDNVLNGLLLGHFVIVKSLYSPC